MPRERVYPDANARKRASRQRCAEREREAAAERIHARDPVVKLYRKAKRERGKSMARLFAAAKREYENAIAHMGPGRLNLERQSRRYA